ncbi:uncharacterized protein [Dysidea avara]|uniref:uncharacterized protein isoform X2 n=1 Tax=Dysidea avara TaxID=196820 RepID=UPI003321DB5A
MAAKWKKLIGKTPDYVGKIKDNLEGHHFATKEVFSHGFPHHPTSLSYDVLQSLVAVGNDMGTIRIFGKAGLEVCLQHDPSVPIKQLIFITNKGYLVSVTNNDTLNLWSLRQRPAGVMHQLQLKKEKVTKCSYTYGSHWLYVGTDKSNVLLIRVEGLALSAYNIPWNEVAEMQGGRRNRPGAVVDMLEHPLDQGKVLLGYTSGLMALWNLATKQVERRYSHTELLTSLCWMSSGKEFAASFYGGAIGVWSVKSNKGPEKMTLPHDTSKGSTPQKKPIIGDLFSPIEKLEWLNVEGNPLFVFTGGTPYECLTPNITLMQGKSLSMLSCDSVIVDFITIPSSPHLTAAQHPKSLLVLCEDGLVVFDISEHGCPHYNVPFVLDLHKPAVTSLEYLDECPDNLTSSLCSVQSKQLVMDNVFKPWPFKGGKWGKGDMELLPADVLITGHCDGSVKFWHANSVSFQQSISVNTLESFERTPVHKMSPSTHKQVVSNEGSSQPEPSSPTSKTGTQTDNETVEGSKDNSKTNEATNKETTSTETPSKESTCSQSSDVKTDESTTPKSKTLPANKQATPVKRSQDGKSETMAHTSSSKSNEKKEGQPKTPDKGKASEGQAKTSTTKETSSQQDDKTTSTAGQSIGDNTSSTKPKTETHSTGDKNTSSDPSTQDPSQPVVTSPTDPDDFVIVDLVDGPVEIPVSEFFPVCHVTLNHDDWSLCVANTGLCVLLYSFHPIMTGSVPIKNLLVKLESPHPPETFSPPGSPDVHHLHGDDIPDSPNPNCGWKVLPETPSTSEGAGFYLVFCCQCVPIDKDQPHPVITCVEYSSKYGILVIGLTSGLVIVDTVNCKCLLVEVDEVELMVDVQANRRSWTSWKAPSSFAKSKKTVRTRSEKQLTQKPSTTNTTVATGSTSTDQGHSQNISTHVGVVTEEEDSTQLCVNTVRIVELNTDKSHMTTGTIWVGTNTGNVIAMGIQVKPATKDHPRTIELCPNAIGHPLKHSRCRLGPKQVNLVICSLSTALIILPPLSVVKQTWCASERPQASRDRKLI